MECVDISLRWASSSDCVVVTDSADLIKALRCEGREVLDLWGLNSLPKQCIVLTFSTEGSRKTFNIAKAEARGACVFCALHVFEASVEHACYLLQRIQESDFDVALSKQAPLLEMLNSARAFSVSEAGQDVGVLSLSDDAVPFATLHEDLGESFIKSVAEFFEIHYAHVRQESPCGFSLTGTLKVAGILVAARNENIENYAELRTEMNRLIASVARSGAIAKVESNRLISFTVGEQDFIKLIASAAGTRGNSLTEFAIGVNDRVGKTLDYARNSQLNEGVAGVHIAVGDGRSGLHIDFLCLGYGVQPLSSDHGSEPLS